MSNRIIKCCVENEFIRGAGVVIGAAGSHDDVELELAFSPVWAGTAKKIVWFDALGENTVVTVLGTDLLVPEESEVYRVPVPVEAKAVEGDMKLTIRGTTTANGVEKRAVVAATAQFKVLPAVWDPDAVETTEPSASVADQLRQEIEDIKGDIVDAAKAADALEQTQALADAAATSESNAASSATAAATSATQAAGSATSAGQSATAAAGSATQAAGSAATATEKAAAIVESAELAASKATAAAQSAAAAAGSAEDAAESATASASSATSAGQSATAAAESAASAAERAEAARQSAGTASKAQNEAAFSARTASVYASDAHGYAIDAEGSASSAKVSAQSAEFSAKKYPIIQRGANGDEWALWDPDSYNYKGTGKPSRGEPGPKGDAGLSAYEVAVKNGKGEGSEVAWLLSLKGKSAYQIAQANGFTGTEAEWLESLKGAKGDTGDTGPQGPRGYTGYSAYQLAQQSGYTGTFEEWLASLKGEPGLSAYEVAAELNEGADGWPMTEAQWLASLQGPKGDTGAKGDKGDTGPQGLRGPGGYSAYQVAVELGYTGTAEQWLASLKGPKGDQGESGPQGPAGPQGTGMSAYQSAVQNGFTGTETEWLASLKGDKGDPGEQGPKGDTGETGPRGPYGYQGYSAYQVALQHGYTGTETEWLASLKGAKGDKGDQGIQGPQGIRGLQGVKGDTGATGPKGDTGPQGPQGEKGETGPQGPPGPAGSGSGGGSVEWAGCSDDIVSHGNTQATGASFALSNRVVYENDCEYMVCGSITLPSNYTGPQGFSLTGFSHLLLGGAKVIEFGSFYDYSAARPTYSPVFLYGSVSPGSYTMVTYQINVTDDLAGKVIEVALRIPKGNG